MKTKHIKGLVPAVFTPMYENGDINPGMVKLIVDHLISDQVAALFVCGTTGEGPSLTTEERMIMAETYMDAVTGRIPVIIQVGHNCLTEARKLACHARDIGATAISAVPPAYFKIGSVQVLVDCLVEIAAAVPELPFYYYHLPEITGVNFDMLEFLTLAGARLPNLAGVKYSNVTIYELQALVECQDGRFDILFGSDEMLTSGLAGGVIGAVGSTYNFAAPLYHRIMIAVQQGDSKKAREYQSLSVQMVRLMDRYRGQPAFKATMKLIGIDCGPVRLPLVTLKPQELTTMTRELEQIGFFDWARRPIR